MARCLLVRKVTKMVHATYIKRNILLIYRGATEPLVSMGCNVLRYRSKSPSVLTFSYEVLTDVKFPSVKPIRKDIFFDRPKLVGGVACISCSVCCHLQSSHQEEKSFSFFSFFPFPEYASLVLVGQFISRILDGGIQRVLTWLF